ncbi:hypothetical protein GCM10010347_63270 [Streptomyces cirratus]|uniref:Transposase n=1 Tax=Streptomyces cirratus TaxID=68187 RepID=A0ABQ3F4G8_9ACTN|nr:hypothetical protein [Streptomyces cirratus]GHB83736.1 hypothetical protein GCM10010347_63270 [Streptomyces cirratus]
MADAAYHGKALRHLPGRITFTTRLPANAVLYDLAPPPTGRRGRPALKGDRLGTPVDLAEILTTVPFGLYCCTITVIWYTLHGHHPADAADRREQAPWYTTKTDPSFSDMLAKLRRTIIAAQFMPNHLARPTEAEIRAVQRAWATAGLYSAA